MLRWQIDKIKTIVREGGRVVIPARYRKAIGIKPGDELTLVLEEGEIKIITSRQAIKRAQALVRRYVPKGRSLSKELIQERLKEEGD